MLKTYKTMMTNLKFGLVVILCFFLLGCSHTIDDDTETAMPTTTMQAKPTKPNNNEQMQGISTKLVEVLDEITETPTLTKMAEPTKTLTPTIDTRLIPKEFLEYVGLHYPPLPEGVMEQGGWMIGDTDNYGISFAHDSDKEMLWLSKIVKYGNDGKPYWEVKNVMAMPELKEGEYFIPDGCKLNGEFDYEIFAIVKWDDEVDTSRYATNDKIVMAWRANVRVENFESIPLADIECHVDNAFIITTDTP